jgi:hypothetical protein
MLSPARAYVRLLKDDSGHWLARPAFLLLAIGWAVSLMTEGRLTLRLMLPAMLYATLLPALEFASLAVVARGSIPFRRTVSIFFASHGPWLLWLVAWSACWGLIPATIMYRHVLDGRLSMIAVFAWSAYLDYRFFRVVIGRSPLGAAHALAIQRLICWGPGLLIFVAPAGWQEIASTLGI